MARMLHVDCGDIHLWQCNAPAALAINKGDACIVQKEGILEFGHVMMESGGKDEIKSAPLVLRRATLQDHSVASENILLSKNALRKCQEKISGLNLPLRLIRVHYTFDRSHLAVVFSAEERIDLRQIITDLSAEMHARVDMRQIGARDAAAVRGGVASCGRVMCCKVWLRKFDNVNVRLVKNQGVPLRPASINGMCGRLKCCLRFESNEAVDKTEEISMPLHSTMPEHEK